MSVSTDYSTPINLYCDEAASDVVCVTSDSEITEIDTVSQTDFEVEDESFIDGSFDSELDQMQEHKSVTQLLQLSELVNARQETVNWMFKVHAYYRFKPETAYLSVCFLDRFLLSHTLPHGKGWPLQLLAVACLSIAAKMEETYVPLLLDIQILEPRFLFKPSTVQRMELLVMARLKWRLRIITPFDFLRYFIKKLYPNCNNLRSAFSRASDVIISLCRVIKFLDYTPSTTAAAAVLWVTNQSPDYLKFQCFHKRVNKEQVTRCYGTMKHHISQSSKNKVVAATSWRKCHTRSLVTRTSSQAIRLKTTTKN